MGAHAVPVLLQRCQAYATEVGGVAQVPVVAVSVSPDLAVPAMVGGVTMPGPPAPDALVLNAATATTAAASKPAIGRTWKRAFIGGTSESGFDGLPIRLRRDASRTSRAGQVSVRCFRHPLDDELQQATVVSAHVRSRTEARPSCVGPDPEHVGPDPGCSG